MTNTIPARVADQVCGRLQNVAGMMRAMRTLSIAAINDSEYVASSVAVAGLCERTVQIIDSCIRKMGGVGLDDFPEDEWNDGAEYNKLNGPGVPACNPLD
jgi:hypothetical protein